jgi:small subunit ribosomal protein S16
VSLPLTILNGLDVGGIGSYVPRPVQRRRDPHFPGTAPTHPHEGSLMAVHIRLSRIGAKKRPFYRIIVADHRSPRGGRFLENIGTYDPTSEPVKFLINQDRLTYWRSHGALPSATLDRLIKRQGRVVVAPDAK